MRPAPLDQAAYPDETTTTEWPAMGRGATSPEDTIKGKIKAWSEPERRQSKRIKDLADIARLVEAHPHLWANLPDRLQEQIQKPD